MGASIGKRRKANQAHHCECSRTQPGTMRALVFRAMEGSVTDPERRKQHSISIFFISIFELENTKCNTTCTDLRIRSENITEGELQEIKFYLPRFTVLVTSFPDIFYEPLARQVAFVSELDKIQTVAVKEISHSHLSFRYDSDRFTKFFSLKVLSGIVLFRIEFLHIFRDAIKDDSDVSPLLLRLLHWEDKIRKRLTKHPREDSGLQYIGTSYLSNSITNAHKWWQPKFIDCAELNVVEEYDLTD